METVFIVRSQSVICLAGSCDIIGMMLDVTSFIEFINLASELYNNPKQIQIGTISPICSVALM
jgi:hypothetical protein